MKVGDVLGLSVKKKEDADKFKDYKAAAKKEQKVEKTQKAEKAEK